MYLIGSSVKLLRRFVIDHSSHEANEKIACLHIFMIGFVFGGSLFYNITQIVAHIAIVHKGKTLDDFNRIVCIGSLIKISCEFVASIILLFMLMDYARKT